MGSLQRFHRGIRAIFIVTHNSIAEWPPGIVIDKRQTKVCWTAALPATGELEGTNPGVPVVCARFFLIFSREPEGTVVAWIDGQGAVVAPAVHGIAFHFSVRVEDKLTLFILQRAVTPAAGELTTLRPVSVVEACLWSQSV